MDNSKAFDAGIKKARQIVSGYVFDCLTKACEELADDAVKKYDNKLCLRTVYGWNFKLLLQ